MNSGIHILAMIVVIWLGFFFYDTLGYTYVGFGFFGIGLVFIPYTLQSMLEDADALGMNPFKKKRRRR